VSVELEVVHHTRYDYAAPVSLAHHLAHLQPLHDAHQQLLAHDLDIEPAPETRHDSLDVDMATPTPLQPGPAARPRCVRHQPGAAATALRRPAARSVAALGDAGRQRLRYVARGAV
jgi:hypothetical protein